MVTRFETWKGKRVIISRDNDNKINTWRYQKGSGIKTKNQAQMQLNKTGTFYEDRVRTGSITTEVKGVVSISNLNQYTSVITSKSVPKKETFPTQFSCRVFWQTGKRIVTTQGYSDFVKGHGYSAINKSKSQAFDRAVGEAVSQDIVTYNHDIQHISPEKGVAIKGDERIFFRVSFEAVTYIKKGERPKD